MKNIQPLVSFCALLLIANFSLAQKSHNTHTQPKSKPQEQPTVDTVSAPPDTASSIPSKIDTSFNPADTVIKTKKFMTGADQVKSYLTLLRGKKVAVVANQTSMVGNMHLVDTL